MSYGVPFSSQRCCRLQSPGLPEIAGSFLHFPVTEAALSGLSFHQADSEGDRNPSSLLGTTNGLTSSPPTSPFTPLPQALCFPHSAYKLPSSITKKYFLLRGNSIYQGGTLPVSGARAASLCTLPRRPLPPETVKVMRGAIKQIHY